MSQPPDTLREPRPYTPRRESFLPPRALPSFTGGAALSLATAAAAQLPNPLERVIALVGCAFLAWLVGYVTPPPRRHFRRSDRS